MAAQIIFDDMGESQAFTIGEDRIYFLRNIDPDSGEVDSISVAHTGTGEPYSQTNQYIRFEDEGSAERFLWDAQHQQRLPYGWQ